MFLPLLTFHTPIATDARHVRFICYEYDGSDPNHLRLQEYNREGFHWKEWRTLRISGTLPYNESPQMQLAHQKYIALFVDIGKNKSKIAVVERNGTTTYLDRPKGVYGMNFTANDRFLVAYRTLWNRYIRASDDVYVYDLAKHKSKHLVGWYVTTSGEQIFYRSPQGKLMRFDTKSFSSYWDRPLESKLARLLSARTSRAIDPSSIEAVAHLPSGSQADQSGYYISKNLMYMYLLNARDFGVPRGEELDLDFDNDFGIDKYFDGNRKVLWSIKRPKIGAFSGFHFTNSGFAFLTRYGVSMGRKNLEDCEPGIYFVNPEQGEVEEVPLPKSISTGWSTDWPYVGLTSW